jgi:hypothetical protein
VNSRESEKSFQSLSLSFKVTTFCDFKVFGKDLPASAVSAGCHLVHRHFVLRHFESRGHIFSHVRPFYEQAVSNLDKSMHRSLWVWVTHSSFIEGSHMTKNTATDILFCDILSTDVLFLRHFVLRHSILRHLVHRHFA